MSERRGYIETGGKRESILSREFVNGIHALSKENFRKYRYIAPALIFQFVYDERIVIPLDLPETVEEKQAYFSAIGLAARRLGKRIYEALVVSSSWYITNEVEWFSHPPIQHPNRKEALQIIGRDYRGERTTILLQPFVRDTDNRPIFEAPRIEQYNFPIKTGIKPVGLLDYLFLPFSSNNSGDGFGAYSNNSDLDFE